MVAQCGAFVSQFGEAIVDMMGVCGANSLVHQIASGTRICGWKFEGFLCSMVLGEAILVGYTILLIIGSCCNLRLVVSM